MSATPRSSEDWQSRCRSSEDTARKCDTCRSSEDTARESLSPVTLTAFGMRASSYEKVLRRHLHECERKHPNGSQCESIPMHTKPFSEIKMQERERAQQDSSQTHQEHESRTCHEVPWQCNSVALQRTYHMLCFTFHEPSSQP